MSALAQRTYQAYFDTNEWSRRSMDSYFGGGQDDSESESVIDEQCTDGDIIYVQGCEDSTDVVLTGLIISAGSFAASPGLHPHSKSGQSNPWVALKKSLQRLVTVPVVRTEDIAVKFSVLVDLWRKDTEFSSSPVSIVEHSAYREVVSWGERAIPLILRDLELNGGHWFQALQELTHTNPVNPADAGRIKKMREAWLNWGRENKFI